MSFPVVSLLVCAAAYAFFIPQLGFYWDDFPMNWIAATMGGEGLARYFSTNRPVWGLFYRLTTAVLGSTPLPWHILALLLRWGTGLSFWWLARLAWPRQRFFAAWAGLLFVIYPGFSQQSIGFLYSHFFIVLNLYLLSLGFTLLAARQPGRFWQFSLIAWLTSASNLLSMEYFFLLDVLRPVLVWLALGDGPAAEKDWRARALKTVQIELPYLVILIGAMAWRSVGVGFQTYQPALMSRLRADPLPALMGLAQTIVSDIGLVTGGAWARAFQIPSAAEVGDRYLLAYGAWVAASTVLVGLYLFLKRGKGDDQERAWLWQPLLVGGLGLVAAGGPFWLTDLKITLAFSQDRFTLSFLVGASLVIPALLAVLPVPRWSKIMALALAVGFAVGMQFQHGNLYRRDWNQVNTFFWQLAWRIPDLQPGTALLTNELPLAHYTDNSLSAPLNWLYDPDGIPQRSARMNYILYYPGLRAETEGWIQTLQKGQPIERDYLAAAFYGNTSQVVVIYFQPPGCLRVLDPALDGLNWMTPEELRAVLPLASMQSILAAPLAGQEPPRLPLHIFDLQPDPNWCYYFEKADLARQVGDWEEVIRLGELAFAGGDYPNDPAERLPFLEGYAHSGNWQRALEISRETGAVTAVMKPVLCRLWDRIEAETAASPERAETLRVAREENACVLINNRGEK